MPTGRPYGKGADVKEPTPEAVRDSTQGTGMTVQGQKVESYTVKEGDTLWDISSRQFNNPWYWPKLWSFNPQISNPNWVYPGEEIKFYPAGEDMPLEVEGQDLADVSKGDVIGIGLESPPEEQNLVQVAGKISKLDQVSATHRLDVFISPKELEAGGDLFSSFAQKRMLTMFDQGYIKFKKDTNVKIGDRLMVFDQPEKIYMPGTKDVAGYEVRVAGMMKVIRSDEKNIYTAEVVEQYRPIFRGYSILPWSSTLVVQITEKPVETSINGVILRTGLDDRVLIGEQNVVYINRGRDDGLVDGNLLHIVTKGDGLPSRFYFADYGKKDKELPLEEIGTVILVDVRDKVSTGYVVDCIREIMPGDKFESKIKK